MPTQWKNGSETHNGDGVKACQSTVYIVGPPTPGASPREELYSRGCRPTSTVIVCCRFLAVALLVYLDKVGSTRRGAGSTYKFIL
jgi:hypothetical protein